MAVAKEQEMKAFVEMRAKVVEAVKEIPKALSQALRRKTWCYGLL